MGDEHSHRSLKQIFRRRAALQKYLRQLTAGAANVKDLLQQAYARVRALSDRQVMESPREMPSRIARNLAAERVRPRITHATDDFADLEPLNLSSEEAEPNEQADLRLRSESFRAAVDSLQPLCRRVFVLRKVYQLSHGEIAQVLNLSHSTIEKHVGEGLVRCRDQLRNLRLLDELGSSVRERLLRRPVRDGDSG